jgi:hypothetical protein
MKRKKVIAVIKVVTDIHPDVLQSRIDAAILRELKYLEVTKIETIIYPD